MKKRSFGSYGVLRQWAWMKTFWHGCRLQAMTQTVLAALVGQKIDLKEIKAIAALRNTDIKAARKKVMAEIQSFDQVTHWMTACGSMRLSPLPLTTGSGL
jgi:hypothetical protein